MLLLGAATSGWLAARGGSTQRENLATCALMTGIFAGTGLVIVPINNKLCSEEELSDSEVRLNVLRLIHRAVALSAPWVVEGTVFGSWQVTLQPCNCGACAAYS